MIVVYTLPNCPQCRMTKMFLRRAKLTFREVDLAHNVQAREKVKRLGYQSAPIVMTPTLRWSGFRPDYLRKVVEKHGPTIAR